MSKQFKNMKIRIFGSKHLARAIYEKLLKLGYRWALFSGKRLDAIDYIFAHSDGSITSLREDEFMISSCKFQEVSIEELMQMQPEAREIIQIGGRTYDKEEFEAAVKDLTPIED